MSDNDKSWPTHCHLIEGWDTKDCCPTCHDDAYEYGYEPCEIEYKGETIFICCNCWQWCINHNIVEVAPELSWMKK